MITIAARRFVRVHEVTAILDGWKADVRRG